MRRWRHGLCAAAAAAIVVVYRGKRDFSTAGRGRVVEGGGMANINDFVGM